MLAVSKSPSLLRTVPRVPGNISILGIKLSDQIRKTYCLTVMIPDFVWFLYGLILYEIGMLFVGKIPRKSTGYGILFASKSTKK